MMKKNISVSQKVVRKNMKLVPKTIVIKLGGSSLASANTLSELSQLISGYRARGRRVVVVHGGGPAINQELTARGITWSFVNGQRVTTPDMIAVIDDVLANKVNSAVVETLQTDGILATGLSGAGSETNTSILLCTQMNEELGLVGQVESVDVTAIAQACEAGLVPVVAPIGFGTTAQGEEQKFNVNADWAATKIAIALGAERLIFLTDQNGVLDENRALVQRATPVDLKSMIESGVVSGGMCTKVLAMIVALEMGVGQVRVLNASAASSMLKQRKVGTLLAIKTVSKPAARAAAVSKGVAS